MIPGPLAVAVAVVRVVWRVTDRLIAPAAMVAGVVAYRWLTGAPMRSTWQGRRLVTRPVRAAGQIALTATAAGLAVAPLATTATLGTLGAATVTAILATRYRAARSTGPRRVRVKVGRPVRPAPARQVTAGTPGRTWSARVRPAGSSARQS
jgi:hypothetical protein